MRKSKRAAALILALLVLTGCGGRLDESALGDFDLISEYMKTHAEAIITDTTKIFECDARAISGNANAEQITNLYLESFAAGKENGYVPVLVFLDDILEREINLFFEDKDRESYLQETLSSERTDGKELLDKRYSELEEYFGEELLISDAELDTMLSLYGNSVGGKLLPSTDHYDGEMYLVKVPADNPFEIFAWLPFGGWNECPGTNEMISICEYWYKEYGAVPAAITRDTLTFYLSDPVSDKAAAVKAAKEQCAFSSEVLGMGGISSYVLMTLNSNVWTFWWD